MVVVVELDTLEARLTPAMQAMATMVAMQVHQLA
jgi:hypothetical protein